VQYIADLRPDSGLAPPPGSFERYRLQEWLNFITSEVHKSFSPLFNPAMPEEGKAVFRKKIADRLAWVDSQLAGKTFLLGDDLTGADSYLFTVTRWSSRVGVDIAGRDHLAAFMARVEARPAVQEAMRVEGLLK